MHILRKITLRVVFLETGMIKACLLSARTKKPQASIQKEGSLRLLTLRHCTAAPAAALVATDGSGLAALV